MYDMQERRCHVQRKPTFHVSPTTWPRRNHHHRNSHNEHIRDFPKHPHRLFPPPAHQHPQRRTNANFVGAGLPLLTPNESLLNKGHSSFNPAVHHNTDVNHVSPRMWKQDGGPAKQLQNEPHFNSTGLTSPKSDNKHHSLSPQNLVKSDINFNLYCLADTVNSACCSANKGSVNCSGLEARNKEDSDEAEACRRMNANGVDRSAMTGSNTTTSENLPWLARVSPTHASQRPTPLLPSASHHPSAPAHPSSHPPHDHHFMLQGATGSVGSLFRPSLTVPSHVDAASRHFSSSQFNPIYTTTGTSVSPYPPSGLYSSHGQSGATLASMPYGPFYPHQYPPGFSHGAAALFTNQYRFDTYAEALANMGSHHAGSQIHRTSFLHAPVPHPFPTSSLTPTDSPGPSARRTPSQPAPAHSGSSGFTEHRPKSPKLEPSKELHRPPGAGGPRPMTSPTRREGAYIPSSTVAHSSFKHASSASASAVHRDSPTRHDVPTKEPPLFKCPPQAVRKLNVRPPEPEGSPFTDPSGYGNPRAGASKSEEHSPAKKGRFENIGHPPPLHPLHEAASHSTSSSSSSSAAHVLPPPPPLQPSSAGYPSSPHYPIHFMKGSIIQLANGDLKRVEELRTDDFVNSADVSPDLKIDSSTVVRIDEHPERGTAILGFSVGEQRIQVTVEATLEHPFFVFGQGWSSCGPAETHHRYGLRCSQLSVGDVCISLTHKDTQSTKLASRPTSRQGSGTAGQLTAGGSPRSRSPSTQSASRVSARVGSFGGSSGLVEGSSSGLQRDPVMDKWKCAPLPRDSKHLPHKMAAASAPEFQRTPHRFLQVSSPSTPHKLHPEDVPLGKEGQPSRRTTLPQSVKSAAPISSVKQRKRRWSAPDHLTPTHLPASAAEGSQVSKVCRSPQTSPIQLTSSASSPTARHTISSSSSSSPDRRSPRT